MKIEIIIIALLGIATIVLSVFLAEYVRKKKRYYKWFKYHKMLADVDMLHRHNFDVELIQDYIDKAYKGIFVTPFRERVEIARIAYRLSLKIKKVSKPRAVADAIIYFFYSREKEWNAQDLIDSNKTAENSLIKMIRGRSKENVAEKTSTLE